MVLNDMNFMQLFLISICFLLIVTLMLIVVFRKFTKKPIRYAMLAAHSILVIIISLLIYFNPDDALEGLIWIIPVYIDFVVSWLFIFLRNILPFLKDSNILGPLFFFLVVGGLQFYLLGVMLEFILKNIFQRSNSLVPPNSL